jgi:hypothetical protein
MQGRLIAGFVLLSSTVLAQAPPASTLEQAAPPAPSAQPSTTATPAPAPAPAPAPTTAAPPPPGYPPYGYQYPYPPQPYPYPYPYGPPPTPPPPTTLPYNEGDPVPAGYHVESRVRRGPIIAGTIMAGTTYVVNLMVADIDDNDGDHDDRSTWLYVPGVGTWAYVDDACDNERDGCSFVIMHSLTHSIGLAMIIYGIAAPKQVLARDTAALRITPYLARSTSGIAATGVF